MALFKKSLVPISKVSCEWNEIIGCPGAIAKDSIWPLNSKQVGRRTWS